MTIERRSHTYFLAGLILAVTAATVGAQTGSAPPPSNPPTAGKDASQAPAPAKKPLTLTGCVQLDEKKTDWFTVSDKKTGTTYRLLGTNVKPYVWRNVRIVGGLVPTATIAAQAGDIDPAKAVVDAAEAKRYGPGRDAPLEFRVSRVQPLEGSCSPKP